MSKFIMAKSFGDSSTVNSEHLLRIAAEEQARRHATNIIPAFQVKAEAERIVQNARHAREIYNPEDE
jgi:hypothetical protein